MTGGLYTAASGLAAQQAWLDSLSNDVANSSTPGYRPGRVAFSDLLYQQQSGLNVGSGVALVNVGASNSSGPLAPTDDPLAVALDGQGYFQVRQADGTLGLTRTASLRIDANGTLVTSGGNPVEPKMQLPKGGDPADIQIAADGTVTAGTTKLGKLSVVDVPAPNGLMAVGGGVLVTTAQSGAAAPAASYQVKQGFVEGSGVDLAVTMTDLVQAQRNFGLQSRVLKMQDQLAEIANGIRR